jgi:hypothetical protein
VVEYDIFRPIKCVDSHLSEMSLNHYQGEPKDIDFVKFFLLYAKVLKVIKLGVSHNTNKKWWGK